MSDLADELRNADLLHDIIASTPGMRALLSEAIEVIRSKFGDHAKIALEPLVNPEATLTPPQLIVVAVTSLPFVRADALLDEVIEEWWISNHDRAEGRVSLATELV